MLSSRLSKTIQVSSDFSVKKKNLPRYFCFFFFWIGCGMNRPFYSCVRSFDRKLTAFLMLIPTI